MCITNILLHLKLYFSVIVETVEDGRVRSQHFTVDTLEEDTQIRSFILSINQKQPGADVTLYIDCNSYGMVATPLTMRDMFAKMKNPQLEVVSINSFIFYL